MKCIAQTHLSCCTVRQLEDRIVIAESRNHLQHVPVFDNFPVSVEAENVNPRPILIAAAFLKASRTT